MMLCVCVSVCAYLRKHHVDAGVQWRERWSIFKTLVCCSGRFPLSFRSSHQRVVATASDVAKTVARKNNNSGDLKPTAICMARTADHATGTMRRPAAAATASAALLPRQHERNYENTREKRWSTIRVCSRLLTYDHRRRVLFLKVILFWFIHMNLACSTNDYFRGFSLIFPQRPTDRPTDWVYVAGTRVISNEFAAIFVLASTVCSSHDETTA